MCLSEERESQQEVGIKHEIPCVICVLEVEDESEDEEFDVEELLDIRSIQGPPHTKPKTQVLVSWTGYGEDDNTWVFIDHLALGIGEYKQSETLKEKLETGDFDV